MKKITTLRDETRTLLNKRPKDLTAESIAKQLNVSIPWVNMFAAGKIENPSVVTIETLNYLLKHGAS